MQTDVMNMEVDTRCGPGKRADCRDTVKVLINKQNTLKLLLYKLYFKMILKSFDFQCDFDLEITTSKMILILNHLYLGYLISILKSSAYDDFAHL